MIVIPDPEVKISKHFTWRDALFLPKLHRMACVDDGVTQQTLDTLLFFALNVMDPIRDFLNRPIVSHVWYRPEVYNKLVGGAPASKHMALEANIAAADFHAAEIDCDTAKTKLMPELEKRGLRMEDNGKGAPWIHIDNGLLLPGHFRFFKP